VKSSNSPRIDPFLLEWPFLLALILLLSTVFLPSYVVAREDAREDETMSNLHEIQEALERYMVDNGEYPLFLLGGDSDGWSQWHTRWDGVNDTQLPDGRIASNEKVYDPLIRDSYLLSYPLNPFVDDGCDVILQTNVDGNCNPGDGDPRFGYLGCNMGMGLDDPNYFKGSIQSGAFTWSEIETRRTLDRGNWMNVPDDVANRWLRCYYLFGGFATGADQFAEMDVIEYWPGNFFYKSTPDTMLPGRHGWTLGIPNTCMAAGGHNRYILGCYGARGTDGFDVIRLRGNDPDGDRVHWRSPPPFDADAFYCGFEDFTGGFGQPGGLPEVFGGGDAWTGPWYYYNEGGRNEGEFLYGAPDGVADGVILVLTDGSNVFQEVE